MVSPTRIIENKRAHKRSKFAKDRNRRAKAEAKKGNTLTKLEKIAKSLKK